jgi:hypothetical protein
VLRGGGEANGVLVNGSGIDDPRAPSEGDGVAAGKLKLLL